MVWSVTVNKGTSLNNYGTIIQCLKAVYVSYTCATRADNPISILPINHWGYHGNVHLAQWYVKGVIYTGVGIGFHYPASIIPRETRRLREKSWWVGWRGVGGESDFGWCRLSQDRVLRNFQHFSGIRTILQNWLVIPAELAELSDGICYCYNARSILFFVSANLRKAAPLHYCFCNM